jgi:uncharacterized phage-associated protein
MKRINLEFRFHFDRSLQAAAHLLRKAEAYELPYIHLLKMLYVADREYLAEYGYMITGDKVVAMEHGPVLSNVLNLIRGKVAKAGEWQKFLRTSPKTFSVRMVSDPGDGDLSRAIMVKLDDVFERYGDLKPFQVVELTHEFTEWRDFYKHDTSKPIPWRSILKYQGKEGMVRVAEENIKLQAHQRAIQKAINAAR